MELRAVDEGGRSTLYTSKEGALYRKYHDTGVWKGPLPVCIDCAGVARGPGNRRLEAVVAAAFDDDAGEETFRGVAPSRAPPAYLRRALASLAYRPDTVQAFARKCGIEISTAWNYASRVVEYWPHAHTLASALVHPPLMSAIRRTADRSGSLRELMNRIEEDAYLRKDEAWQRLGTEQYAHLRLGRLCVLAPEMLPS